MLVGWLIAAIVFGSSTAAMAGQSPSEQGLGSAEDYVQSNPDSYVQSDPDVADAYKSPLLGILVKSGRGVLGHGSLVDGVEVLTVIPGSPAGAAGLHGSRLGALHTGVLTLGIITAAVFFPPAIIGVLALNGIAESRNTIIAVDGERTRDVNDFEEVIAKAHPGEMVYLTIVNRGQRRQIRVSLPVQ